VSLQESLSKKWVIVQLSPLGEREKNTNIIANSIRRMLGNKTLGVFIPAISEAARDESHTVFYMEGYIFVEFIDTINYLRLHEIPYFKTVIVDNTIKRGCPYSLLDDRSLNPMRVGMEALKKQPIKEGDRVRVIKGTYKNLVGDVEMLRNDDELVTVNACLASKPMLIELPASFLRKEP
jgi:transcription antitermination factor NusG